MCILFSIGMLILFIYVSICRISPMKHRHTQRIRGDGGMQGMRCHRFKRFWEETLGWLPAVSCELLEPGLATQSFQDSAKIVRSKGLS